MGRGTARRGRGLSARGLERGVTARRAIGYAQALAQLAGSVDARRRRSPRRRRSRAATRAARCRGSSATPTSQWLDAGRRPSPLETRHMSSTSARSTAARHRVRHRPVAGRGPHPAVEQPASRHPAQAHRAARAVPRRRGRRRHRRHGDGRLRRAPRVAVLPGLRPACGAVRASRAALVTAAEDAPARDGLPQGAAHGAARQRRRARGFYDALGYEPFDTSTTGKRAHRRRLTWHPDPMTEPEPYREAAPRRQRVVARIHAGTTTWTGTGSGSALDGTMHAQRHVRLAGDRSACGPTYDKSGRPAQGDRGSRE